MNPKINVDLPTKEELERAEQYKDKIPDYKISSGHGTIQAGIIVDTQIIPILIMSHPYFLNLFLEKLDLIKIK